MAVVFDHTHCYQVLAVFRGIYHASTVGVVSYLVKLDVGVPFPDYSELGGTDVGKESRVTEYANVRVIIKRIVVVTVGFRVVVPSARHDNLVRRD